MTKPLGTDQIIQIGILVKDVHKTAADFADFFGMPMPDIAYTDGLDKTHAKYLGKDCPALSQLAFFNLSNGLQIELIQPDDQPSLWRDCLDKQGEGLHHVAFVVKDTDKKLAAAEADGLKVVQTGDYEGGRYAYIDAKDKLKMYFETLENF